MKKIISLVLCGVMLFAFSSCGNKQSVIDNARKQRETTTETLENVFSIREEIFVATVDNIYRETQKYIDDYSYVKYVGFVLTQEDPSDSKVKYPWVCRYGPGCCGSGTTPGFVVVYDGELPAEKTWVEVTGKLKIAKEGDDIYNYLHDLLGTLYNEDNTAIATYAYFEIERVVPAKPGLETVGIT
ncbi:MAG: hypothetical protein E7515_08860 [Ruminococcaceae bacterium]|jgi:uncharacterized membrane protein YcgQ (UPF0703/DUF1980 family)|nr:hypothetical protein [Oscillospiraceae bacterium]